MDAFNDRWYSNSYGNLTDSVSSGKEDIVERLLEIPETNVLIQNRNGATAL